MQSDQLIAFVSEFEQASKDAHLISRKQQENIIKYFKTLSSQISLQADVLYQVASDYSDQVPFLIQNCIIFF